MAGLGLARIFRLCLKELRESLRDRRTIVTLILMPLLVYPLLSLVLNRVLLTGVVLRTDPEIRVGVANGMKDHPVLGMIIYGRELLLDPYTAPTYLEQPPNSSDSSDSSDVDPGSVGGRFATVPKLRVSPLSDEGYKSLENGSIDVLIIGKTDDQLTKSNEALVKAALLQMEQSGQLPPGYDTKTFPRMIGGYDIRYRAGDLQSERAVQLLERCFAAVNNSTQREFTNNPLFAPFRLVARPITGRANYADLLATIVPLVLVLMTMAGAVYPAIDLTAGERERGTMESLIVSPTSTPVLLFAKYCAVVLVALLTAVANLTAMSITLWASGIGALVFGEGAITPSVIGIILLLLVLFTMFFAALLLAVTSFAKSFKEAQAYLIPLMLLALAPAVMSLLPGIKFSSMLATIPLVNIVLLARQVLMDTVDWNATMVALICNSVYAVAALAVASKLFGTDASAQGSQGSWRDLLRRPHETSPRPRVDQMAMTMAVMFPIYFVVSSILPSLSEDTLTKLWISAGVSFALLWLFPILVSVFRRIQLIETFRLRLPKVRQWLFIVPAVLLIGCSAWMVAHEIFVLSKAVGLVTLGEERMEQTREFRDRLQRIALWKVLFVFAITPAICEEFLFRGFVLSSLSRLKPAWAVILSSLLFGLMHVLTSQVLAVERFLPSTFMGILLGLLAVRTRSLWPGIVVHALHNGLLLTTSHYQNAIRRFGILAEDQEHLPATWLLTGGLMLLVGIGLVVWSGRRISPTEPVPQRSSGP